MRDDIGLDQLIDISGPAFIARISGIGKAATVTPTQATEMLNVFTPSLKGLAPASGGGSTAFLRADGTWAVPTTNLTDGDKGDITISSGGTVWSVDNNAITYSKIQNATVGLSIIGRSVNTSGVYGEIVAGTDGHVLRRAGTSLDFGTLAAGAFAANTIGRSILSNGVALSVVGRSPNSTGAVADIATSSGTGAVLRESGGVIGWGTISTIGIGDGQVTYSKVQNVTGQRLLGRFNAITGTIQEITLGSGLSLDTGTGVLTATGSGGSVSDGDKGDIIVSSSGTVWTIENDSVSFAKMQNINTSRLLGRYTAASGDVQEITLDTTILLSSGGVLSVNKSYVIEDVPGTTYLFTEADNGKIKRFTSITGCTVTVPTGLSLGWNAIAYRGSGTGLISFVASGTTLEGVGTTLPAEKTAASVTQRSTNIFILLGALSNGLTFGTVGQIPYMNSGGTDFNYEAGFEYDTASNRLTSTIVRSGSTNYLDISGNSVDQIVCGGTSTDINLNVWSKGEGFIQFGGTTQLCGVQIQEISGELYISQVGFSTPSGVLGLTLKSMNGNSSTNNGANNNIVSGNAYSVSGNGNGGDIFLSPGGKRGSGRDGKILLGKGGSGTGVGGSRTIESWSGTASIADLDLRLTLKGADRLSGAGGAAGGDIYIIGGNAETTTGNFKGGNIVLQSGVRRIGGTATDGDITIDTLTGYLIIANIPTSSAGLPSGAIWSNSNVLTRVP